MVFAVELRQDSISLCLVHYKIIVWPTLSFHLDVGFCANHVGVTDALFWPL